MKKKQKAVPMKRRASTQVIVNSPARPVKRQVTEKQKKELKALSVKVRKLELAPEEKQIAKAFYQLNNTVQFVPYLFSVALGCVNIPSGTDVGNRIGNSIRAKRLFVRVTITTQINTSLPQVYRILVLNDKQPTGTTEDLAGAAKVFGSDDSILIDTGLQTDIQDLQFHSYMESRYKVYRDVTVTLTPQLLLIQDPPNIASVSCSRDFDIPLNHIIQYKDGTNNISSVVKNLFQVAVLQSAYTEEYVASYVSITSDLRYTDE